MPDDTDVTVYVDIDEIADYRIVYGFIVILTGAHPR